MVLGEHDGLVFVRDYPVLQVSSNRPGQYDRLQIATLGREPGHIVSMRNMVSVLLDDRTFIEISGRVVRGSPDEFHSSIVGLPVRVRSNERWKE